MLCLKPTPRFALRAALVFSLLFSHGVFAADDGEEDAAEQWRGVSRIEGRLTIDAKNWANEKDSTLNAEETVEVRFTLVADPENQPDSPNVSWYMESAHAKGSEHVVTHYIFGDSATDADFSGEPDRLREFGLGLDTETGAWEFSTPRFLKEPYTITTAYTNMNLDVHPDGDHTITNESRDMQSGAFNGTVSGVPGVTTGKFIIEDQPVADRPGLGGVRTGRLVFSPVLEDVELEITSAEYQKWRPLGSIKQPSKPGNNLLLRATLKPKDGKVATLPKIKALKFTLLDTSREPGVCMNWPLDAKDKDYDLRLAATPLFNGTLSNKDQTLTITDTQIDAEKHVYAEAQLDSYDFGGKAELMVTAKLADGREVIGKLKQDDGEQDIVRLPRRLGSDWVAAQWREDHQVEKLADDDDAEEVKGQEFNGDGYTLYEEYRGFIENGRHIDGDPKKKDVFIYSELKADGRAGIALFGRAGKLGVHGKLRPSEMDVNARLMNGNHREAPHVVDQHGIYLVKGLRDAGAKGVEGADGRRAFRPRYVKWAFVTPPTVKNSAFSLETSMGEHGFSAADAASMYDRAIAHELLHTVGADHHGEQLNVNHWVFFQGASHPFNPTGRARFTYKYSPPASSFLQQADFGGPGFGVPDIQTMDNVVRGTTVTLLWEDTKKNVAEEIAPEYERKMSERRAATIGNEADSKYFSEIATNLAHLGKDAAFWNEYQAQENAAHSYHRGLAVMQINGTDSGNEMCLMRYYFGNAYKAKDQKDTYYVVRPGDTKIGKELCTSAKGSGANDHDHDPQSRAGDAWAGGRRGNCANNVCPNDAIPPRDMY